MDKQIKESSDDSYQDKFKVSNKGKIDEPKNKNISQILKDKISTFNFEHLMQKFNSI